MYFVPQWINKTTKMKKLLLILLCPILLLTSCVSNRDFSLVNPLEKSLSPKLQLSLSPYEIINNDFSNGGKSLGLNTENVMDFLNNEINKNIIINSKINRGTLVPNIEIYVRDNGFFNFLMGATFFTGPLFGLPIPVEKVLIISEFQIKDANNKIIWEKAYTDKATVYYGLYWKNSTHNKCMKLIRKRLDILKDEIDNDYSIIQKGLDFTQNSTDSDFEINNIDIREIDTYTLPLFIDVFLNDCKQNNIYLNKQNIKITFNPLDGNTIALAYAMNDNNNIVVKVDPSNWENSSLAKKWYIIYHELGHDVLNLEHGEGGKMMFNFADREYDFEEFFNDKKQMFNYYKSR
tara:strand:- start:1443 stop:2486 length:1044 start_codon:yes stop_codon:yes gene_type:complete